METWLLSLLTAALLLWLFTSLGLWIWALRRAAMGRAVLEPEPRASYPGGLAEVLICVGVYFLVGAALAPRILPDAPAEVPLDAAAQSARMIPMIVLNSAATLSAVAAALAWMGLQGLSPRKLGLLPRGIDFVIGGVAAVMLLPPVFALQGILASLIEYHHPLLDVLQLPQSAAVLAAMAISSTLIAPLAEEFFFRGLLQGWLSGLAGIGRQSAEPQPDLDEPSSVQEMEPAFEAEPRDPQQPYAPSHVEHLPQPQSRPWWPTVVTSLAFAVVHLGQGPAPITLFFLALGLGYLYRQTGRIWAPIVVHMALNGLTTAATILSTAAGVGQ
ncbi:CPBP family intramembrane glutamic endopeptidase [Candidatus Laterigemmans baculatus]|uniref:CPBP family intramembrane glutamic endopeptidase n=1 Tax=Candidatus Laterigemmans baculatus TaxID=2770505 RepID=UPI0013DA94F2|nr:CPBP family intramembrane glutamic endopeptidase [Candidatus Laterigemmans baculatus]